MTVIELVLGALLGAGIGSFVGCAAYRIPRRISLNGRSRCPACGEQISAWRNIPILTFLVQRGRAACCGEKLRFSYLGFEAACAGAGAGLCVLVGYNLIWVIVAGIIAAVGLASWWTRRGISA